MIQRLGRNRSNPRHILLARITKSSQLPLFAHVSPNHAARSKSQHRYVGRRLVLPEVRRSGRRQFRILRCMRDVLVSQVAEACVDELGMALLQHPCPRHDVAVPWSRLTALFAPNEGLRARTRADHAYKAIRMSVASR
jgi:hypothetical protein